MKIGVIGTGSMGRNHVRVLRNITDVKEIVIAEVNEESRTSIAKTFGIKGHYRDHMEMLSKEKPDGVIVATPPENHKKVVIDVMHTGIHVLVEKPISHSIADAEEMIRVGKDTGVIFTVGHVERFNPVISQIKKFIDDKLLNNIYLINTRRVGPFPKRLLGKMDGVLVDLAVHDFDIIEYLGGRIENIQSQIIKTGSQEIYVKCLLDLENEIKASSEFSWITPMRDRSIEIYGDSGMIKGDYFNQEVWFFENSDFENNIEFAQTFIGAGLINAGKIVKYPVYKQEPLFLELNNFISAIKQKEDCKVKPEDALSALKSAFMI